MKNLKARLSILATASILVALAFGYLGSRLQGAPEQIRAEHLAVAALVFVGLCGVTFYILIERALSPVMNLTDTFVRMQAGDLNPRLPVEGPEEMQQLARDFNRMIEDLEIQIRDITDEKHSAERGRQYLMEQLIACQRFMAMVDSSPIGIMLADPELNIVYQNAASESGFLQLTNFLPWNAEVVVGRPLPFLYSEEEEAREILSDPDRLPYETSVPVGPYSLRFMAGPTYTSEGDYLGPMLMWEVLEEGVRPEEAFQTEGDVGGGEPEVEIVGEEDAGGEMEAVASEVAAPQDVSANGAAVAGRLKRGATLVGRSVRLLSDRLSTVNSMVEALRNEGDNLRRCLEETRQRTQNVVYLTAERSEALWELVQEVGDLGEKTGASAMLVKRLRRSLKGSETIAASIADLTDSIEHMVVEARIEVGRAGEAGGGMKVVLDEIQKLGREAVRLNRNAADTQDRLQAEMDDVLALLEEDRREGRSGGRLSRRAENALGRIERDLGEVDEKAKLLAEMAVGQSEIGTHIGDQLTKLAELVDVTVRVVEEQVQTVQESLDGGGESRGIAVREKA